MKPVATVEKVTLSADTLFHFDKSGVKDLLPKGRAELDALAQKPAAGQVTVQSMTVTGYADRLGSAACNQRLGPTGVD